MPADQVAYTSVPHQVSVRAEIGRRHGSAGSMCGGAGVGLGEAADLILARVMAL
jgi:hypothetical protein